MKYFIFILNTKLGLYFEHFSNFKFQSLKNSLHTGATNNYSRYSHKQFIFFSRCTICEKRFSRSDHLAKHLVSTKIKYYAIFSTMKKINTILVIYLANDISYLIFRRYTEGIDCIHTLQQWD